MLPMQEHSDESQDMDMIKSVLQKIIDQMDQMEADNLMPEARKPKVVEATVEASPMDMSMDDDGSDSDDASLLPSLMDKAKDADDEGALPEDKQEDVDPAIASIIAEKKKDLLK